jgi:hypothetical protein
MKLKCSLGFCVNSFNKNHITVKKHQEFSNIAEGIQEEYTEYKLNCDSILGLNLVKIDENKDDLQIEFSGKILGADYWKLNQANTIMQALSGINQHPAIEINPEKILENAIILHADVTQDIPMDEICEVKEAIDTIKLIGNRKYMTERYEGEGIAIRKILKQCGARLILYDKQKELFETANKSKNRMLMEVFDPNVYAGKLRVELNLKNFKFTRRYLETNKKGSIFLKNALLAKTSPALRYFEEWENAVPDLFNEIKEYKTFNEYKLRKGWEMIITSLEFDELRIREMLMYWYSKSNANYIMRKQAKPIMQEMRKSRNPHYSKIIEHIKKFLKNPEAQQRVKSLHDAK